MPQPQALKNVNILWKYELRRKVLDWLSSGPDPPVKLPCPGHIPPALIDCLAHLDFLSTHPEPMHGPRRLQVVDIQATQVTIRWEPLGYNVTRCHSYNLTVQYRSKVGGKEETREEVCYDTQSRDPQHTIHNLTPFTNLSVKLVLRNPEGVMESTELKVQTDEDGKRHISRARIKFSYNRTNVPKNHRPAAL